MKRLLWIAVATLCLSTTAQADDREEAREFFEAGVAQLRAGNLQSAAQSLQRSLDLYPSAPTASNLAGALLDSGQPADPYRLLNDMAQSVFGELPQEQREEVLVLRAQAEARRATIEIRIVGADQATVQLADEDSFVVAAGQTVDRYLNPGSHQVTAVAAGQTSTERVEIAEGSTGRVLLRFEPPAPEISLTELTVTGPDGASAQIVGVAQGVVPLRRSVAPGEYTVRLVDGEERTMTVGSQRTSVELELGDSESAPVWPWIVGVLVVAGAAVAIAVPLALSSETGPADDPFFGRTGTLLGF